MVDKVLAIIFPITAFVAMGFEHSVANMYFIPAGLVVQTQAELVQLAGVMNLDNLTLHGFLFNNLLPVTLGNIIGGRVFVVLFYFFLY